jgi:type 1 glutamine amidotransferase
MKYFTAFLLMSICLISSNTSVGEDGKHVLFIAGKRSHGPGSHEHRAGCMLLADHLTKGMPGYTATVVTEGWPQDSSVFDKADAIVIYCDGGKGHVANPYIAQLDPLMKKGVGLGCLHYAVETEDPEPRRYFLNWMGGYFETHWSVNPHWLLQQSTYIKHPVSAGLTDIEIKDEWYYHMRFVDGETGITPIFSAVPPSETLKRKDGPHSGNPEVRAAVLDRKVPQHVFWTYDRAGDYKGRGFGFTGGHFHNNWADDSQRRGVLNAIVWIAGGSVPEGGVPTKTPTSEELEANQDKHGELTDTVFQYPVK